ncbi:MAG: transposase, partial [Dermatophilaceae bacterium]
PVIWLKVGPEPHGVQGEGRAKGGATRPLQRDRSRVCGLADRSVVGAWGFTTKGERVLLDVTLGQRERVEDWTELGQGMIRRGLRSPLLVVTDGAPGLVRAVTELWPDADRQRCAVHRLRNVLAKLPRRPVLHARVRAAYWAALDVASTPDEAEHALRALVGDRSGEYPSAAACLVDDLPALTVHLLYPPRLKKRLRSTNLLERSLEEVRRTKVIGRFPGETSCLTMAWAVMELVIAGGRGLALTLSERHQLAAIVSSRSVPESAKSGGVESMGNGAHAVTLFQQLRDAYDASRAEAVRTGARRSAPVERHVHTCRCRPGGEQITGVGHV